MREEIIDLLNKVLITHSPGDMENEMNEIVKEHISQCASEVFHDPHDNIYIKFAGKQGGPLTLISAHKDELSLIVRKIDDDGKIWLEPIGGSMPFKYGEGPFDLITSNGIIEGVLCIGSTHSSDLSSRVYRAKTGLLTWDMVYLDCKLDQKQLKELGAMVGDRAVIGRRRKQPMYMNNEYVCGYALDDKAAVVILLILAKKLKETPPIHNVCLAITSREEAGVSGGAYISRHLDPFNFIAVEIVPVVEEYPIKMNEQPVVLFKDGIYHYSPELSRELISAGKRCGIECQTAVIRSFGSDASVSAKDGLSGRSACIGFPTENTHGYEIVPITALENCIKVLFEYFCSGIGI
jgi:putative aminopeptidase FrvX